MWGAARITQARSSAPGLTQVAGDHRLGVRAASSTSSAKSPLTSSFMTSRTRRRWCLRQCETASTAGLTSSSEATSKPSRSTLASAWARGVVATDPRDPLPPRRRWRARELTDACWAGVPRGAQAALDASERIGVAPEIIDLPELQLAGLERALRKLARRQTGCKALMGLYGMGELTSLVTLCQLGGVSSLHASRQAVRFARIPAPRQTGISAALGIRRAAPAPPVQAAVVGEWRAATSTPRPSRMRS